MNEKLKAPIGSHTYLDTFERCPKQAWHKYVLRDQPFVETKELKWGNAVHTALEHRCGPEKTPLPDTMRAYETFATIVDQLSEVYVEEKLGMRRDGAPVEFFSKQGLWLRGKVDVLSLRDNTAFIIDWKTGKKREDPRELEEHALLVKARYPNIKVAKGCYVWLKDNEVGKTHDLSDFDATYDRVAGLMEMADTMLARQIEWPARQNPLCGWCGVHSCRYNPKTNR
jgi:hypothetical protein